MWMTIVFMLVASTSKGRGSGHMLVFTLMVMVSASVG